ncbi:hypothetical protein J6590_018128 [Homalodisca vitripennis]|nr:hypothetical protein J6590_018128 [Homalodisca vitripennis]
MFNEPWCSDISTNEASFPDRSLANALFTRLDTSFTLRVHYANTTPAQSVASYHDSDYQYRDYQHTRAVFNHALPLTQDKAHYIYGLHMDTCTHRGSTLKQDKEHYIYGLHMVSELTNILQDTCTHRGSTLKQDKEHYVYGLHMEHIRPQVGEQNDGPAQEDHIERYSVFNILYGYGKYVCVTPSIVPC